MQTPENYIELNRQSWNARIGVHIVSEFYDVDGFLQGASSLNDIELELLGDVAGKRILHLQCHFGQDTLSLARLDADVTGIDLSDRAIDEAQKLNEELGLSAEFICCNLYDLPEHLNAKFDVVFTSYGTIGWLPDLQKWAQIVAQFLQPGGKFVFVEFHPVVWMFDDDFKGLKYSYFNTGATVETSSGTYADASAPIETTDVGWNHSLSEVISSLIAHRLVIHDFKEYNYSPYACFKTVEKIGEKKYIIPQFGGKIPMVYSVVAVRPF
ncbi:MAG TPA: class I SAM-dependent methyltransferase [Patescibacteria group bacterium]|nr:class I SAM-dependent methyltransferase [Patescibacteria group bacterium]